MRWMILAYQVLWIAFAYANVEKTIFLAPGQTTIPANQLSFDQLQLESLTPYKPILHRQLQGIFPTENEPRGAASWYLLDSLNEHQRYELRVCWLATVSA